MTPAGPGQSVSLLIVSRTAPRWDRDTIREGTALVADALRGRPGRFALRAAITALNAEEPSYGQTDWPQLLRLYGERRRRPITTRWS